MTSPADRIDIGNAFTEMAAPMAQGVPQANGEIAAEAVNGSAPRGRRRRCTCRVAA